MEISILHNIRILAITIYSDIGLRYSSSKLKKIKKSTTLRLVGFSNSELFMIEINAQWEIMLYLIIKVIIKNKNYQTSTKHACMFGEVFCDVFDVMFGGVFCDMFGGVFGGEVNGSLFFACKYQAISFVNFILSLRFLISI